MVQIRLQQLVIAESDAWRLFSKALIVVVTGVLLNLLGVWVAGTDIGSHLPSPRSPGIGLLGFALQGIGGFAIIIFAIPLATRFARWLWAIWQRRRFSGQ
ncbi:hypothetical protein [Haloferula sp. BvORR071]|uniref:hypothetical protein n=1 Tax=Haloferula sp. BvORR071 TaxID=1396141 RepID=UPI000552E3A7|nr:hypothetical protein [Haloferula sp. BvORR071]